MSGSQILGRGVSKTSLLWKNRTRECFPRLTSGQMTLSFGDDLALLMSIRRERRRFHGIGGKEQGR